jgi:hypothetical protein
MRIYKVKDIKEAIKNFNDEWPLISQVVAADETVWNMTEIHLYKVPGNNDMVGINLYHPHLKTLPKE